MDDNPNRIRADFGHCTAASGSDSRVKKIQQGEIYAGISQFMQA
jgi:hypothetical protein